MAIAAVEDAIIAACIAALNGKARDAESLPGGWTLDMLQRSLQIAPCVYVAYQGSTPGQDFYKHKGRFTVYTVSKGSTEPQRRRGNSRVMGAYDMLERLLPALSILAVPDIGQLKVTGVENLFRDAMFELGGTVYGIQCELPNMPFDPPDISSLQDFVTWHAEHQVGGADTPNPVDEFTVKE